MCPEPERKRGSEEEKNQDQQKDYHYDPELYPQWCPGGLTRSQKRRLQRLRYRDQEEKHAQEKKQVKYQIWLVKPKADELGLAASVNMVFFLPMELKNPADEEDTEEAAMAQLTLDPMQAIFDKPAEEERHHLKPFYVKGYVNGRPMTKMMIDGGAAINIMP
ncbi:unnamed protein product [Urochloa humidicola]